MKSPCRSRETAAAASSTLGSPFALLVGKGLSPGIGAHAMSKHYCVTRDLFLGRRMLIAPERVVVPVFGYNHAVWVLSGGLVTDELPLPSFLNRRGDDIGGQKVIVATRGAS